VSEAGKSPFSDPFVLRPKVSPPLASIWEQVRPAAEWLVGFRDLGLVYARASEEASVEGFLARALIELGIECDVNELDLARIPQTGPCVVVANHPFGGVEGIVLGSLLRKVRKDVKIVANHLLARLVPMREVLLFVDPFGSKQATSTNGSALREALRYLKRGGMLVLFPAGEVAHLELGRGQVVEAAWSPAAAWLARVSGAPVLPVHFRGRNSALFQLAGLLNPQLRTALLPRELVNKRGQHVEVRIGGSIAARRLAGFANDGECVRYLRQRVAMLARRSESHAAGSGSPSRLGAFPISHRLEPLAASVDPVLIDRGRR
jgi:putative hemolysin